MPGILIPVVLIDPIGRKVEIPNMDSEMKQIMIPIPGMPLGCLLFDKTEEKDPITFAPVFRQRIGSAPSPFFELVLESQV